MATRPTERDTASGIPDEPSPTNQPHERWTETLLDQGFVPISRIFLRYYAKLPAPNRPTTGEAMFVIHLMDYKRDRKPPWPSYNTLAAQMGVSAKMTRLHAKRLEEKGLLRRKRRLGTSSEFDLTPLFTKLERCYAREKERAQVGGYPR